MSGYNIDDNIWEVIENYFRTINKNLVSHQLDSFNMFIMNQIPKTIRQFNPMVLIYENQQTKTKNTLEITIGGSVLNKDIINDGNGIFISKPVFYEKKQTVDENGLLVYEDNIKQLYPNEARLKNITYGVNIFVNIFINFNGQPMKYTEDNKWAEASQKQN